jgi:hypothetical protein
VKRVLDTDNMSQDKEGSVKDAGRYLNSPDRTTAETTLNIKRHRSVPVAGFSHVDNHLALLCCIQLQFSLISAA